MRAWGGISSRRKSQVRIHVLSASGLAVRCSAAILQVVGLTFEHWIRTNLPLLRLSRLAGHHSGHFRFDPEASSVGYSVMEF